MPILPLTFIALLIAQLAGWIAVSWWIVFSPLILIAFIWLGIIFFLWAAANS